MTDHESATTLHTLLLDGSPGNTRTVRVWFGDLPEAQYPNDDVLFRTAHTEAPTFPHANKRVVVELARPICGPSTYALLGGSFVPNQNEELRIEAAVADSPGPKAPWAMPPYLNYTNVWLQRLNAEAAIEAAAVEAPKVALGGGVLRFDRAVEDQVGSSQWTFTVVASAVVHLLTIDGSPQDEELAEFFRKLLVSARR